MAAASAELAEVQAGMAALKSEAEAPKKTSTKGKKKQAVEAKQNQKRSGLAKMMEREKALKSHLGQLQTQAEEAAAVAEAFEAQLMASGDGVGVEQLEDSTQTKEQSTGGNCEPGWRTSAGAPRAVAPDKAAANAESDQLRHVDEEKDSNGGQVRPGRTPPNEHDEKTTRFKMLLLCDACGKFLCMVLPAT